MTKRFIVVIALLAGILEGYGAKTFVGKVSGIESKDPFTAPKIAVPQFADKTYNVKDFGAKGDSVTNDTQAINKAIEKCNAEGGGSILFPAGRYIAASIHLKSNICFRLDVKAEIYGAAGGYDAPESHEPYEKYQDYGHSHFHNALMWGEGIENFAIIGGKVTGGPIIQGDPKGKDIGDKVIVIVKGKNLLFKNVTHDTGGHFVYLLNDCENITLDHVVIKKSRDAVDFMGCRNVQVFGCHFTGCSDDTIGIKSDYVLGRRILSENFYVWDCYFESGCNGLQFGSENAGDFRNIRIWSVKIALSMKAGIGITSNDSGIIEDVQYRDIEVTNAACPIFILITDRLRTGEPNVHPGKIKDVTIKNVTFSKHKAGSHHGPASTATISGLPGFTIDNLTLENIKMTNAGGGTTEDAKAVPPYLKEYSPNQYKTRPAAAFFVRHVKNLTLKNVEMTYETPDFRSPLVVWDATGLTLDHFNSPKQEGVDLMTMKEVTGLTILNSEGMKNSTNESVKEGLSMKSFIKPAPKNGGFQMDGYFLWCPSVIKVGDTYHLFCSRWPESVEMGGWTTWSECVRATSKNLFGPYKFEEVVLQKRDSTKWDKSRVHNVKILKIGAKYVLYYISTKMNTGYAFADKITGPWTRIDQPAMHVTNPAVLVRPDNSIYVIGRGEGPNKTNIATAFTAPAFDGAYSILKEGKNVLPEDYELEDPTIWWANNQYNILVNDWKAKATGLSKGGAQYYSKDGLSYTLISKEPVFTKTVEFDDHTSETFNRRERPSVFVNEKGEVVALFTTCLPANGPARIVIQPVDNYYPKN